MPPSQSRIDSFLAQPILARLATVSKKSQPHVVPVWFLWEDSFAWVSSFASTRKVKDLIVNPKCALVVDMQEARHGLTAVLLEGEAELLSLNSPEVRARVERLYTKYLNPQGILAKEPQEWLNSSENLLVKLIPTRLISW